MSSKSKKGSNEPRKPKSQASPAAASGQGSGAGSGEAHDPFEDLIETPPGRSRLQSIILIFLMVFLLIVFIVPFAFQNALMGDPVPPAMTYDDPDDGTVEVSAAEFTEAVRKFDAFAGERDFDDQDVGAQIVLDAVARAAGIAVGDDEFRESLQGQADALGGTQAYKQRVAFFPGGVPGFENYVRQRLRVSRYTNLLGRLARVPDPDTIEERWNDTHVEYAFDYAALPAEDLLDEARAEVPDDAALEAWFEGRPEWERRSYEVPARTVAALAYYPVESPAPAALLDRYPPDPPAEGEEAPTPAEVARDYYDRVSYARFPYVPDEGETPDPSKRYESFEDVAEVAELEAPVYFAMVAWQRDAAERAAAGEEVDLAAEAEALGLALMVPEDGLTPVGWRELESLGGPRLASAVGRTAPGELLPGVVVETGAISFGRVTDRTEAALPPFEEIRDDVAESWAEERARELATERLSEVREGLVAADDEDPEAAESEDADADADASESTVDAEAFRAAAEAAGLEVRRRDWLDRAGPREADPNADDPAHRFLASRAPLYQLEEGELSEPLLDAANGEAYLVRSLGSRPVDLSRMRFTDFQQLSRTSATLASFEFLRLLTDENELERLFEVRYPARDARSTPDEPPADAEPEPAPQPAG